MPPKRLLALAAALSSLTPLASSAAATKIDRDAGTTPVPDHGTSRFSVAAATADLSIRKASAAENTPGHVTACSGGRIPCVLVDRLVITVAGQGVAVPRTALLMLADVNRGKLLALAGGRYELDLFCGDAAASYEARLQFDRHRLRQLDIWDSESGMLAQRVTYADLSHAFH